LGLKVHLLKWFINLLMELVDLGLGQIALITNIWLRCRVVKAAVVEAVVALVTFLEAMADLAAVAEVALVTALVLADLVAAAAAMAASAV
jgi:hypothetical protein